MFKPLGLVLLICVATLALVAGCTDGESGGGGGGGSTPAGLAITPNPVAFGTVSTSSTTTVTVTVTNNATTSIDVTSVSILNDTNTVFSLVGAPGATTPIAASASIQFDVQFTPGATAQASTADLEVQNTGPTATITVSISGTAAAAPTFAIAPTPGTPEALGTQSIGGAALTATFTITNTGTANLDITSLSISGTDYSLTTGEVIAPATVTVAPSTGSHVFTVEFDDTGATPATNVVGSVVISHNAGSGTTTINFTADVVAGPTYPPFLPIQATAGLTLQTAVSSGSDDDGQYDVDISTCPFPFNSTTFDRVSVSTNGYIRFGSGSFPSASGFNDDNTFIELAYGTLALPQISFLAEDCTAVTGTTNFYHTVDTANQRIVLQLENFRDLSNSGLNSVQVILYCSAGGNIQISYYNSSTFDNNAPTWSIGVSEPATTATVSNFDFVGATLQQINTGFNLGCIAQDPKHATVAGWTALDGRSILFFRTSTANAFETVVDTTP
ncbi:MAG: choice-of-anchor D domain-containing protein [Planctomycetes bacterium]|nr:choice-of-anchor D domain-containing protein [Planctomycetota bacterium]